MKSEGGRKKNTFSSLDYSTTLFQLNSFYRKHLNLASLVDVYEALLNSRIVKDVRLQTSVLIN